jgi:PhzF family phenazine biosynthesis protein
VQRRRPRQRGIISWWQRTTMPGWYQPEEGPMTGVTVVDAFTSRAYAGNPAAVVVLDGPADERWMRDVAREMNLSETAFTHPLGDGDGWRLRWFTPAVEVALCGHATLATAHVLWEEGHAPDGEAVSFATASGTLAARRAGARVQLDFPSRPVEACAPPDGLTEALGVERWRFVGHSRRADRTEDNYLVELESEAAVRGLVPDVRRLADLPVTGVIVTSEAAGAGYDFVSRYFAPAVGVAEDPVTGSAHCSLGPYWQARLHRSSLTGWQASARGGEVGVTVAGDRVHLAGHAVTVLRGTLLA